MNVELFLQHKQAFACPSCESSKLLLTKEQVVICESCFRGYPVDKGVVNFRLQDSVSFKPKLKSRSKSKFVAEFVTLSGVDQHKSLGLKPGHCVVLCRQLDYSEHTLVASPQQLLQSRTYTQMPDQQLKLIQRYLRGASSQKSKSNDLKGGFMQRRRLGSYERDQDFFVSDRLVSRIHIVLYHDGENVHLLDLMSRNGTYVNGKEVECVALNSGDVFKIGQTDIRVEFVVKA